MKEKLILLMWLLFTWFGLYLISVQSVSQQYDYNGWLFKKAYAAVTPDSNNKFKTGDDLKWNNDVKKVIVNVWEETVTPASPDNIYIPPVRHSH